MKPATRSDWRTKRLPRKRARISLDRAFSAAEMQRIEAGLVPEAMEDKWFIYFDSNELYFHRSWSGFCLYVVEFVREESGGRMTAVLANRNPQQYANTSDEYDRRMISYLIDALLLQKCADFPAGDGSAEESAIAQWSFVGRAMFGDHPAADSDDELRL